MLRQGRRSPLPVSWWQSDGGRGDGPTVILEKDPIGRAAQGRMPTHDAHHGRGS